MNIDDLKPIDPNSPFGQAMKKFKNFGLSQWSSEHPYLDYDSISRLVQENVQEIDVDPIIPEEYFEKTQEYQQQSLAMLQSINQNTANLYTLVDLINKNNENQEELLAICSSILDIATAKSKDEAESKFTKAMSKINDTVKSADSMVKIIGWATTVYNMVSQILQK